MSPEWRQNGSRTPTWPTGCTIRSHIASAISATMRGLSALRTALLQAARGGRPGLEAAWAQLQRASLVSLAHAGAWGQVGPRAGGRHGPRVPALSSTRPQTTPLPLAGATQRTSSTLAATLAQRRSGQVGLPPPPPPAATACLLAACRERLCSSPAPRFRTQHYAAAAAAAPRRCRRATTTRLWTPRWTTFWSGWRCGAVGRRRGAAGAQAGPASWACGATCCCAACTGGATLCMSADQLPCVERSHGGAPTLPPALLLPCPPPQYFVDELDIVDGDVEYSVSGRAASVEERRSTHPAHCPAAGPSCCGRRRSPTRWPALTTVRSKAC